MDVNIYYQGITQVPKQNVLPLHLLSKLARSNLHDGSNRANMSMTAEHEMVTLITGYIYKFKLIKRLGKILEMKIWLRQNILTVYYNIFLIDIVSAKAHYLMI